MLKNDQTYIKILRCEYRNIFKVVWVFFDIMHEGDKQKALTINNDLKIAVCRCFFKTGVLTNSQYSQENTCVGVFIKKRLQYRRFLVNIARTAFSIEYLRWLLLNNCQIIHTLLNAD